MSFRWVWLNGESPSFDDRDDAEAWMGREWSGLLEGGVEAATLKDGDEELYTMKLTPSE